MRMKEGSSMNRRFVVKRKKPGEFCYEQLPWKATNGVICSDFKTSKQATKGADRMNRELDGKN